jgi:ABC-type transporter Mla MlaB component
MNKRKKAVSPAPKRKAARAKPAAKPVSKPAATPVAQPPPTSLTLAAECLVAEASSLKAQLARLIDEPLPVTLDISALQRIDTAALQLITAFVRERAGHGRPLQWHGTAPVLASAARLLGLTMLLELPA